MLPFFSDVLCYTVLLPKILYSAVVTQFFYEAIDRALKEIKKNHPGERVHIVGHSIGGAVQYGACFAFRSKPRLKKKKNVSSAVYNITHAAVGVIFYGMHMS